MLVISEDDVICRSCGILISTLDRLEMEMRKTRDHILRFLEQKYSLEDGELRGDKPKPCQPPQITRSMMKEIFCGKPRNESDANPGDSKAILKKSHSWLQCDKCKYTIRLNSFMMHHLRDHIKQRLFSDNYGQCSSESQQDKRHSCNKADEWDRLDLLWNWKKWCIVPLVFSIVVVMLTCCRQFWCYYQEWCSRDDTFEARSINLVCYSNNTTVTKDLSKFQSVVSSQYLTSVCCIKKKISVTKGDSTSSRQSMYVLQSINVANNWQLEKKETRHLNSAQETEAKDKGEDKKRVLIEKGCKSANGRDNVLEGDKSAKYRRFKHSNNHGIVRSILVFFYFFALTNRTCWQNSIF